VNCGATDFFATFAEGPMHLTFSFRRGEAEFGQGCPVNHGSGRAGVDREVADFPVGLDRQSVGILVPNELGAGITVRDDILIEPTERDGAVRGR
jgi:hypothetical protein